MSKNSRPTTRKYEAASAGAAFLLAGLLEVLSSLQNAAALRIAQAERHRSASPEPPKICLIGSDGSDDGDYEGDNLFLEGKKPRWLNH